jgi:enamine deaminase RidA (YjgF/YER057c/UK114 family)
MHSIEQILEDLQIRLPDVPSAIANYVNYTEVPVAENHFLVIISGQLPMSHGSLTYKGKVGSTLSLEDGQKAARLCIVNVLSHLKTACDGDLSRVQKCLRIGGFVQCEDDFVDHPKVINGASDLIVQIFGDHGRHARSAVGVNSLPLGACVEIEAMFLIEKDMSL